MRIGIYGGTFNPIHNTHIEIAKAALSQFNLDRVYFLVAGTPPHKETAESISDFCRLEMVKLAISDQQNLFIDDRELYRSGKSFSYITMTELKGEYPNDDLFFIMGSDSLLSFKDWVMPEVISECATILVAPRLGDDKDVLNQAISDCNTSFKGDFALIDYTANGLASSTIRSLFYKEESVRAGLCQQVVDYIFEHNLYSPYIYTYEDVVRLLEEMKKALKPSRYIHTLGVASTAYSLAIRWNYPAYTAMVAGVLHDCAKCISDEERISICENNNIPITDIEYKYPHLLHGKVGAFFCEEKYDIFDKQIAHSIVYHTTGCPNMNLLDKIIYVADYIEPGRDKQPRLDVLRSVAYTDLDKCVFMILDDSVYYLNSKSEMMDPKTIETYNFYLKEMEKRGK